MLSLFATLQTYVNESALEHMYNITYRCSHNAIQGYSFIITYVKNNSTIFKKLFDVVSVSLTAYWSFVNEVM